MRSAPTAWRARIVASMAVGGLLPALAGCGAAEVPPGPPADPSSLATEQVAAASDLAERERTAAFTLHVRSAGEDLVAGTGRMDVRKRSFALEADVQGLGRGTVPVEKRVVDEVAYVRGFFGRQWFRLDSDALPAWAAGLTHLATDPTGLLPAVRDYGARLKQIGPATLGSRPTTRYAGVLDLSDADPADPANDPLLEALRQAGLTTVPFVVHIDRDGRPARMVVDVDSDRPSIPDTRTTVDYRDWGEPVRIEAPADAVPAGSLFGGT